MTVRQLKQAVKPLSADILVAFFSGSQAEKDAAKVASIEGSRLQSLFQHFPESDTTTVKEAVKGMKEAAEKADAAGKKSSGYKSAQNRARDVQLLYGAWRFANMKADGMGYHGAVEAARNLLAEKAIRWTGEKLPSKAEKEIRKKAENAGRLAMLTEKDKLEYELAHPDEEADAEKMEQFRQANAKALERATANSMAATMFKTRGAEWCGWLIESLEGHIANAEQEAGKEKQAATG